MDIRHFSIPKPSAKLFPIRAIGFGLLTALIILSITCLSGAMLYVRGVQALKENVRHGLIRTATVAAAMVDGDAHQSFTSPRQETTPAYFRAIKPLAAVQMANGDIKYVSTFILRDDKVYFVLDPTPPGTYTADGIENKSHIMQYFPDAHPKMLSALRSGKAEADDEPTKDEWGMLMSGYAPIHDSHGRMVGIVGVAVTEDRYVARLAGMLGAAKIGFAMAVVLAAVTGSFVFVGYKRLLHAEDDRRCAAALLQEAYDDLEKRVAARTTELADANWSLNQAYHATIEGWSRALDLRDEETHGHSERVTLLTLRLAAELHIDQDQLIHVERGALLHDIGKMAVPDAILEKRGPLTEEEWEIMRLHPFHAWQMLSPIEFLRPALDIPLYHHEKWDGTGYPQGVAGEEIPLSARLFAVVDVWDALCSDRPYRKAWSPDRVLDHIHSLSGTHFDPEVVRVFMALKEEELRFEAVRAEATGDWLLAA